MEALKEEGDGILKTKRMIRLQSKGGKNAQMRAGNEKELQRFQTESEWERDEEDK